MILKNLKNTVEIKGDVALIHINRKGYTRYLVVDTAMLPYIDKMVTNRLNADSGGFIQHRTKSGGKWKVFQLHRAIIDAFEWEKVTFKNGNKLDCRTSNLVTKY